MKFRKLQNLILYIGLCISGILVSPESMAQTCDCEQDLRTMIDKYETDYAGFENLKVEPRSYKKLVSNLLRRSKKSFDLADCERLLTRYINYVDDGHVYITKTVSHPQKQAPHSTARLNPSFSILSDSTVMIRIPSAELKYRRQIDSLIRSYSPLLTRVPYMIIDVRGNRGGGDAAFSKLKPYLYTRPVIRHLPEFLATPGNISLYRQLSENQEVPLDTREFLKGFIRKMEKAPNTFVSMTGKLTDTLEYDSVYPNPRKIGILIDGKCGSATEEFLLFSKQSSKVIIFGKENSSGTLDFSNLRTVELPSGFWTVTVPTSRSSRLPQQPFDKTGISPDVRLPKRDSRALSVVINYLKTADH